MDFLHLPFGARLEEYAAQAEALLEGFRVGDEGAVRALRQHHPQFRDSDVPWLVREDADAHGARFALADARLGLARAYCFLDWAALEAYAAGGPDVMRFEAAVEATLDGDVAALRRLLRQGADLASARSQRVTCFEPAVHGATLLHYLVANGTENYRQRTPKNAVEVARLLLEAGADANAEADLYGGKCTVMSMLVSSSHPAAAGVQEALIDLLVDFGAAVEARGAGRWTSPLLTALVFGFSGAAETLVRRGARVDELVTAAGMGHVEDVRRMLAGADAESRHAAFSLAAQLGRLEVTRLLLAAGESADRYNPDGFHKHCTPLHQAALRGDLAMAQLLVEHGARADRKDRIYQSTAVGWARHNGQTEVEKFLHTHFPSALC